MFSYAVVTLNEDANILDCILSMKSFGAREIYLLDGGSVDKTISIAKDLGCKVIELPGSSISFRRGYALDNIDCDFLFFVDADQRLASGYSEHDLFCYFNGDANLAGLQLRLKADSSTGGYWAKGFAERLSIITGIPGKRRVIGTPCVFRKRIVKDIGYEKHLTGPSDDTLFCSRIIASGYHLLAVKETAYEIVRSTFKGSVKKAFWYGMGDSEYLRSDSKNLLRHLYHIYIRGILIYPFQTFFTKSYLVPFFIIFGLSRGVGAIYGALIRVDLSKTRS